MVWTACNVCPSVRPEKSSGPICTKFKLDVPYMEMYTGSKFNQIFTLLIKGDKIC